MKRTRHKLDGLPSMDTVQPHSRPHSKATTSRRVTGGEADLLLPIRKQHKEYT